MFALVLFSEPGGVADPPAPAALSAVPGMAEGLIFTPAAAKDSYVDDGAPPPLGMQLHFPTLEGLEAACAPGGAVAGLLPDGVAMTAQAFWRRTWAVPDPEGPGECSYVVHYPGPAEDLNAWLAHYIAGHPPLFQRFPGIRGIEILTRVDWVSGLPCPKAHHMQRNRVVFDSPAALAEALASPVRHELRADFHTFPPFEGGNFHYPMHTRQVRP